MRLPKRITAKWLLERRFCKQEVRHFKKCFPDGVPFTLRGVRLVMDVDIQNSDTAHCAPFSESVLQVEMIKDFILAGTVGLAWGATAYTYPRYRLSPKALASVSQGLGERGFGFSAWRITKWVEQATPEQVFHYCKWMIGQWKN